MSHEIRLNGSVTVRELLTQLEGLDPEAEVKLLKAKKVKTPVPCWCGCGGTTKSRFQPGHDARFHGQAKRVARDQADYDDSVASLPHEEAVAEFQRHVELERPIHELREKQRAEEREAREAVALALS